MWMSTEDARSDFILAAAAVVFGSMVAGFLFSLPFYPTAGLLGQASVLLWIALTSIVPARYLARNRGQGIEAFGLGSDRSGLNDAMLLVVPLVVAGYVRGLGSGGVGGAALGRIRAVVLTPSVGQVDVGQATYNVALMVLAMAGAVFTFGLLTVRARDAFRATDMPLLEALRTFGMGAAGVSLLLGLLRALANGSRIRWVVADSLTLALLVLITDRLVSTSDRTTRATILGPAVFTVIAFIIAFGGPFGPNLIEALYRGSMAGGLAIVVATLIETRRSAWAIVPLIVVSVWAPTCAVLPVGILTSVGAPGC